MARPLRVIFQGAWYHVMNRGAAHGAVFREPSDYRDFLSLLEDLDERFQVEIHGFCAMGNHYHVLLRTPQANLSPAMRHLDGVLTQRLHRRRGTDGPVFRGRFRAVLVQADRHLAQVSRYIHLNPVEAGLAARAEDWPWSSYRGYLDPAAEPGWLWTGLVLQWFGNIGARQRYREFVEAGLDPGTRDFYGRPRWASVLGGDDLVDRVRQEAALLDATTRRELPELRSVLLRAPLPVVARAVAEAFEVAPESLRVSRAGRDGRSALARGALVHAARRLGGWHLHEIAAWIGYRSYSGASQAAARFAEAAAADPDLRRRLEEGVKSSLVRSRTTTHR